MFQATVALCAALALPSSSQALRSQEQQPAARPISDLMPAGTLLYLEGPGLSSLLKRGLEQSLLQRVMASSLGAVLQANMDSSLAEVVDFVETVSGVPLFETASSLVDRGLALGLHTRVKGKPGLTLVARSTDDGLWPKTLHKLLSLAAASGEIPRSMINPSKGPEGVDTWDFGQDLALAHRGGAFVASNDPLRREELLQRLSGATQNAFSKARYFREARQACDPKTLLWGWLALGQGVQDSQGRGGLVAFSKMAQKPGVHLLLGSGVAALGEAQELSAQFSLDDSEIRLRLRGHGIEQEAGLQRLFPGAAAPESTETIVMPHATERDVGRLVAYRDFHAIFEHRADFFPPDVLPAFSRMASELAPILGGLDLGEDILPGLSGWIRLVSRTIEFEPAVRPEQPLPAVVMLVDLLAPEELGPQLISSFQTLIALLNVERAQQGDKPMLLFIEQHEGISYSAARYLPPGPEDGVDISYNLVPACAVVGKTFLIGTHLDLVREVAEQLRTGKTTRERPDRDRLVLGAAAIVEVLQANHDALVMNTVLDEGKSVEEASSELDMLLELIGMLESVEVSTRYLAADTIELDLRVELVEQGL